MHEVLREISVGEGAVDARERVAELRVETSRTTRERERRLAIDGSLVDDVTLVGDGAAREILSRVRAGRSAVLAVENDHEGIKWWS